MTVIYMNGKRCCIANSIRTLQLFEAWILSIWSSTFTDSSMTYKIRNHSQKSQVSMLFAVTFLIQPKQTIPWWVSSKLTTELMTSALLKLFSPGNADPHLHLWWRNVHTSRRWERWRSRLSASEMERAAFWWWMESMKNLNHKHTFTSKRKIK